MPRAGVRAIGSRREAGDRPLHAGVENPFTENRKKSLSELSGNLSAPAALRRSTNSTFIAVKPSSRPCNSISELGVLGLGLLVDRNVGIGVLPQIQERLVGFPRSGFIALHFLCTGKLQPRQGSRDMSHAKTGIVDHLLELSRGRSAIAKLQIRQPTDVGGVQIDGSGKRQIILGGATEQLDGCRRIVLSQLDRGPDGWNEVMLHERVLEPFRADLVCEFTSFRCSS